MGSIETRADVSDFKRLFEKSSLVEGKLKTALRRNIRVAAEQAADKVRLTVSNSPGGTVSPNPHSTGLRLAIAAGVKVKVMTGARAGVTIAASSAQMPTGKESLVRAWEIGAGSASGWRHPVFGKNVWVTQKGHPYFAKTIYDQKEQVRAAVEAAMVEAAESLK